MSELLRFSNRPHCRRPPRSVIPSAPSESVDVKVRVNAYIKIFVCTCVIGTQQIPGFPSHVTRSNKKRVGLMSSEELIFSLPISMRDIQLASQLAYV
ncbi:SCAN domain-containing protein 3 [Trichonephila clavipes]|nr:SCAN domain-containing protein 3 [Trichonephila clavipes]